MTFTATDAAGYTASCASTLYVGDTTGPTVGSFQLAPTSLSPANHTLRSITVPTITATDVCDPEPLVTCAFDSNEAVDGFSDDTLFDMVVDGEEISTQNTPFRKVESIPGQPSFSLSLRAERANVGFGRTYRTRCTANDDSGNTSQLKQAVVLVP